MLTHVYIKNYTIVKSLKLELSSGLTVLTGETGAGKSIVVDAVMLALGGRADTHAIHAAADRCDISLCFDITHIPTAQAWLTDHEFADENNCIIRRTITRTGRSRSTINGHPCSQHFVRELAEQILAIQGQHQHQALLQRTMQQTQLDNFAQHQTWLAQIQRYYHHWQQLENTKQKLMSQSAQRDQQLDLLRYQSQELTQLNLQENEWYTLNQQHQRLHHTQMLVNHLNQAMDLTAQNDQTSAAILLQQVLAHIDAIIELDERLTTTRELVATALIHVQEAADELMAYHNQCELSAEHLPAIEQRLTTLHAIARKHRVEPQDLATVQASLAHQIQTLENIDADLNAITDEQATVLIQYRAIAKQLSDSRIRAANTLEKEITANMHTLGMHGGQFKVQFSSTTDPITPYGQEKIAFLVSTNPGQACLPLHKIVSGGELSRISLALQVISAQQEGTPTLIFDEVDSGIGGKTAEIVGQLLRELGCKAQVICITHLPQVAAQGQHHCKVEKITSDSCVTTTITHLTRDDRITELARMLSGTKISDQTLAHAAELLA